MSRLKCICGHVIVDQTDNNSYKGYILPDGELEDVSTTLTDNIDSLVEATKSNRRLDWIKSNFHVPPYPLDLKDSAMIHDLISSKLIDCKQQIFECENCGRVLIQLGQTDHFKSFLPENKDERKIFVKR